MQKRLITALIWLVILGMQCRAQQVSSLNATFKVFLNSKALKDAPTSFCVMNAENGKTLFNYQDTVALTPASCLKIATTGAALGLLGANYRFRTFIGYEGRIDTQGTLHGDIVILGGGDPTFGSERWGVENDMQSAVERICKRIHAAGVKKIDGKVVLDLSRFDSKYCSPSWACDDTGNYFGARACAFNIGENEYHIRLQAGTRPGTEVKMLTYSPESLHLHFDNYMTTGEPHSGDQSNIYIGSNDSFMTLDGSIQPSQYPFTIKGAIPDPPEFAAKYFAEKFYASGLLGDSGSWHVNSACNPNNTYSDASLKAIDTIESPELIDIVHYTNLNSINLYAECILKEIGKVIKSSGTRQGGIAAAKQYWAEKGVDTTGLIMVDGCGLARNDKTTALQLCTMLSAIKKQTYFPQFLESLPVAGKSSSMKDMGKGTAIDGILYCKTGHINGIRAYSGYIKDKQGKWLCFSLIVNDYNANSSQIFDAIEKLLVSFKDV